MALIWRVASTSGGSSFKDHPAPRIGVWFCDRRVDAFHSDLFLCSDRATTARCTCAIARLPERYLRGTGRNRCLIPANAQGCRYGIAGIARCGVPGESLHGDTAGALPRCCNARGIAPETSIAARYHGLGLVLLLLVPAIFLLLLCIWIVIPPFNESSIILAVASIECSPYLLLLNLALLLLAWRTERRSKGVTMVALGTNCALCTLPILALIGTDAARSIVHEPAPNLPITELSIPVALGRERTAIRAYLPTGQRPSPAVFAIYGGAWRNGSPRNDRGLNRGLAHAGYAVFALDYRHSPKYRFPAALDDVRGEIALIRGRARQYRIDPAQIAVLGHSSGGQLAELIAFEQRSPVRALVSYSGAVDLAMGWKYPPMPDPIGVRRVIENYIGDTPDRAPGQYRAATPLAHVRSGLPPVLLIYGSRDHVVEIRYARKLRDALRTAGARVTFLELPWTEHAFEDVPFGLHAPIAYEALVNFLQASLKGSYVTASGRFTRR